MSENVPMNGLFRVAMLTVVATLSLTSQTVSVADVAIPDFTGVYMLEGDYTELRPADGSPLPLTPAGKKLYDKHKALRAKRDYVNYDLTMDRCASPGAVRMMTLPYTIQFFQRPKQLVMLFEWNHLYRLVNLDKPKTAPYPLAIGISNGRWDGDTLVVETTSFTDNTLLDTSGLPHSDQLRVTERIRLVDGRLENAMTLHDPKMFSKDWSVTLNYRKTGAESNKEVVCLDRIEKHHEPAIKGQQAKKD